jgi:hypothetical protein
MIADAAAKLHRHRDGGKDRAHRHLVHRLAGEGAVEIDHMQPLAAGGLELGGLRARVVAEHGGLVHLAMQQADTLAALQVDGGVEDHDSGISCFGASVSLRFL